MLIWMKNKVLLIGLTIVVVLFIGVIILTNSNQSNYNKGLTSSEIEKKILKKDHKVDIKTTTDKKNIYLFWGDGCSHCAELSLYLNEIKNIYKKHYNLYTFEVWNDAENHNLMESVAATMNEEVEGVPYLVIGDKTFSGYADDMKKEILTAIKDEYKNDNYFDAYQNINSSEE